jgi:selenide,water dikinase
MAANMRLKAKGEWIDEALENMLISNGPAAQVFSRNNVRSMTDVTGFGLAGHLAEMLKASAVGAEINLNHLQFLNGAAECLEEGIQSSLAPDNKKRVSNLELTGHSDLTANIIFDPQTSGGLLAGVKPNIAKKVVEQLKEAGCARTTIIGKVTNKPGELALTRVP